MSAKYKKPIQFSSFGGYRKFCAAWWVDLSDYAIGLDYSRHTRWDDETPLYRRFSLRRPGWYRDLYTYWHRARYGWAPRDTWSLDRYLNGVLAGSLERLANDAHGAPHGYPSRKVSGVDTPTDFEQWQNDLHKWAKAFSEDPRDVDIYDSSNNYKEHTKEEKRRYKNLHKALKDIEPWWENLWD